MDVIVNATSGSSSLVTIWQQQRNAVALMGQALHDQLPAGEPPVTIHGRELEQGTEGIGFQFQLTIKGELYDGQFQAAYYVVQIQLIKRRAGLGWLVDAMPVLEVESSNYDLYTKRSRELAFRDRAGLETYMLDHLATDATGFFNNVRASVPPQEPATPFGEGRKDPVL
jgi:hypothetical protein